MTMEKNAMTCCLLAISFAMAQVERGNLTLVHTTTTGLNITTTVNLTIVSNVTENTTPFTRTTRENTTTTDLNITTTANVTIVSNVTDNTTPFTSTTSHTHTSELTTNMTSLTNTTSLMTTPGTHTAFAALTTTIQTTTGYKRTPTTTVITTASETINITSESEQVTTQGLGLNISEKSITIVCSVILGLFAIGLVILMFNRCKHKFQYLHQPLNNNGDTDIFVADDDTLVISGGLYDGHPIYDNVPTASADQSQFRLEFLN